MGVTSKLVVHRGPTYNGNENRERKNEVGVRLESKMYTLKMNGFVGLSLLPHCPDTFCDW